MVIELEYFLPFSSCLKIFRADRQFSIFDSKSETRAQAYVDYFSFLFPLILLFSLIHCVFLPHFISTSPPFIPGAGWFVVIFAP